MRLVLGILFLLDLCVCENFNFVGLERLNCIYFHSPALIPVHVEVVRQVEDSARLRTGSRH